MEDKNKDNSALEKNYQEINALTTQAWDRFCKWSDKHVSNLEIPPKLSDVFIPRRIFEIAQDPKNVHIYTESTSDKINMIIYETLPEAITDMNTLNEWVEGGYERPETEGSVYNDTWAPEGVDYMHLKYPFELNNGFLKPNDFVYLQYIMKTPQKGVAYQINYFDRPELRRKGIAGDFYSKLEEVLRRLEFKYLVGQISSPNPTFFDKDRIPYNDLPIRVRLDLPAYLKEDQEKYPDFPVMVKTL